MNSLNINDFTDGVFDDIDTNVLMDLEITLVYPNINQPRKVFVDIDELASSIKLHGLMQPIVVVFDGMKYMIISGERRYRACMLLELKTIKALIVKAESKDIEELALIENIQRNDLTDFETARFIGLLWNSKQYPLKKDLALAIGKKDTYISKALSVLKLDDHIIQDIETNKNNIPFSVMEEISRVGDSELQNIAYTKYTNGDIKRDDIKKLKPKATKLKTFPRESFKLLEEFTTTGTILNKCFSDFEFEMNKDYTVTVKEL